VVEQPRIKRQRQQIFHAMPAFDLAEIRHHDGNVAAEFPDELTARAAGRRGGSFVSATTAIIEKARSPSESALKRATRSTQTVSP
jgi:hypothetical protein